MTQDPLELELISKGVDPVLAHMLHKEKWTFPHLKKLSTQQLIDLGLSQEVAQAVRSQRIGFMRGNLEVPSDFDEMGSAQIRRDFLNES